MLQVKLWNKQIPSYTHRYKPNTQTRSARILPPSVSSKVSAWKHVWTISALNSAFIAPQTWKLFRTGYQSVRAHPVSDADVPVHAIYRTQAARLCQCFVWQWAECGGPSGHPRHAMIPVKCCQRGLCGLLWRLKACSTALPAQAADLRKGNLGRSNGGVAPELFTERCAGPAPPTIFHMRTSVCGACRGVRAWVGGQVRVFTGVWKQVLLQGNAAF